MDGSAFQRQAGTGVAHPPDVERPIHSANALQVQWLELSDGCAGQVQGQDQKGIYSITHQ